MNNAKIIAQAIPYFLPVKGFGGDLQSTIEICRYFKKKYKIAVFTTNRYSIKKNLKSKYI